MAKTILASAAVSLILAASVPALAADPAPPTAAPAPPPGAPKAGDSSANEPTPTAPAKTDAAPTNVNGTPAKTDAKSDAAPARTDAKGDAAIEAALAAPSGGDAGPAKNPAQDPIVSTRRAGFTVGVTAAAGFGDISGYPLDINKRGKAQYLTDTGAAVGANGTVWLGGALTDWLVFGLGVGGTYSQGNGTTVKGYTFIFHTEFFPLFWLGGPWREAGISLDTGAGQVTGELDSTAGKVVSAAIDSGAASRVGASLFYEGFRLWKVSTGPFVAFDYTWSASLDQPLFLVGLRTALYTKAPSK